MSELVEKKTIGEVEHIVHASRQWDGTGPVEFSDDGETWVQAWSPTVEPETNGAVAVSHPKFARVEVFRKDVRVPTTVTIRWDEQFPAASEEWAAKWFRSPMRHFGRTARMVGFRQTFRDLLGDIVIEDEADDRTTPAAAATAPVAPVERRWAKEIAEAQSPELLDAIEKDARAARIFTPDAEGTALHRQLRTRRREIEAASKESASAWDIPAEAPAETVSGRPAPNDYLPPVNRAARRKAARKKGGKR
ncbi:hypothetical protein DC31_13745 [Microbacterium sp. CH12i]|uniref:hypothetical protein n=1 Tax=Microbacterium sp. CH12i TaxID=1479651 RepID=UPI000460CC18|nr:hypothetical protein [Microbacterium sp. CH12i]KDA05846.1 hypothetical protein DC31_13745 [Microbacterium sp. CH12i]